MCLKHVFGWVLQTQTQCNKLSSLSENSPVESLSFLSFTSLLRKDISSSCFFLFILRVTACCLRRKEGEFRTFRSYTEEDIFLWVWFNRQEAADSHFSVMLFLWVQDSQVSLWVFFLCVFFSTQFWNMSLIFLAKLYFPTVPLNKKVKYSALRQKGMLDEYI